jgi:hypothetical protein
MPRAGHDNGHGRDAAWPPNRHRHDESCPWGQRCSLKDQYTYIRCAAREPKWVRIEGLNAADWEGRCRNLVPYPFDGDSPDGYYCPPCLAIRKLEELCPT